MTGSHMMATPMEAEDPCASAQTAKAPLLYCRMRSIRFKLVLGAILLSLLVALVAAVAVTEQLQTADAAARLDAANVAAALAYSSADEAEHDRKRLQRLVLGLHEINHRDTTFVDMNKIGI